MDKKDLSTPAQDGKLNKTQIGIAISVAYSALLLAILFWRLEEVAKLPLNELGDFAAGAFGPMAILWLVLGYFQQGEELKQNTEALHLQAEELKSSVEQQKALVELTKAQMQRDKEISEAAFRPHFTIDIEGLVPYQNDKLIGRLIIKNHAERVRTLKISPIYMSILVGKIEAYTLDNTSSQNFYTDIDIDISDAENFLNQACLKLIYLDGQGMPNQQVAVIFLKRENNHSANYALATPDELEHMPVNPLNE